MEEIFSLTNIGVINMFFKQRTGIQVTGSDASVSKKMQSESLPYSPSAPLDIENDEAYYAAHPPAKGFSTLSFIDGTAANHTPSNPNDWQMITIKNEEAKSDEVNEEETTSRCVIS